MQIIVHAFPYNIIQTIHENALCQFVSPVLLWSRENTYCTCFGNTAAVTASGPFRCQRKRTSAEQRERARKEERERWWRTETDRKHRIGIHGWFQLTHPSLPHILYITFALQCSKCLTHSWWKRHVCSQEKPHSRSRAHSQEWRACTLTRQADAKTSFF